MQKTSVEIQVPEFNFFFFVNSFCLFLSDHRCYFSVTYSHELFARKVLFELSVTMFRFAENRCVFGS